MTATFFSRSGCPNAGQMCNCTGACLPKPVLGPLPSLFPAAEDVARLTKQRDDARDELANMVDVARQFGQLGDFLKHALADRDYHRERGDEYAERCDAYLATIDELASEVAELKRELAWHTETTR